MKTISNSMSDEHYERVKTAHRREYLDKDRGEQTIDEFVTECAALLMVNEVQRRELDERVIHAPLITKIVVT